MARRELAMHPWLQRELAMHQLAMQVLAMLGPRHLSVGSSSNPWGLNPTSVRKSQRTSSLRDGSFCACPFRLFSLVGSFAALQESWVGPCPLPEQWSADGGRNALDALRYGQ
jgi:hypothetical protein